MFVARSTKTNTISCMLRTSCVSKDFSYCVNLDASRVCVLAMWMEYKTRLSPCSLFPYLTFKTLFPKMYHAPLHDFLLALRRFIRTDCTSPDVQNSKRIQSMFVRLAKYQNVRRIHFMLGPECLQGHVEYGEKSYLGYIIAGGCEGGV
jgi:hypothetical protein